jgi:transcriptional regulator with XRE-family HTH domain
MALLLTVVSDDLACRCPDTLCKQGVTVATSPPDEPEVVGSATRRRLLGRELRRLRRAAGLAIAGAATTSGLSTATISRLESAKQKPLAKDVRMLCQVYGADETLTKQLEQMARESEGPGWWLDYAGVMPGWAQRYADEEAEASVMWNYLKRAERHRRRAGARG